ncbi:MAG: hypothetical protein U0T72_01195 [Chitinophagales bacterium]
MDTNSIKSLLTKIFLWFAFILIVIAVIAYFISGYTYSEGNRAGLLIKFHKEGYFFKTYEGELNIGGLQPSPETVGVNLIWHFSVKDEATAQQLKNCEGKYVSLHYHEVLKNFFWQGETNYFVDGVEIVKR